MSGRILMIFTTKSLIYSCLGALVGLVFYFLFKSFGFNLAGLIAVLIFALIGFGIATLKMPETNSFELTRKTGGEKIDDIIFRAIKFKLRGKRIYVYTKEDKE